MAGALKYREAQFTQGETAAITGVSLHLQRDWRGQGLLRPREGGRAMFTPRELAELSMMLELRNLGVPLAKSREHAEHAAPGLLLTALQNHTDEAVAVQGPPEFGVKYVAALESQIDGGYLATLADLADLREKYRFALVIGGDCKLLHTLKDDMMEGEKGASLLNLFAMATALVENGRAAVVHAHRAAKLWSLAPTPESVSGGARDAGCAKPLIHNSNASPARCTFYLVLKLSREKGRPMMPLALPRDSAEEPQGSLCRYLSYHN